MWSGEKPGGLVNRRLALAYHARQLILESADFEEALDLVVKLFRHYESNRPCRYARECVLTGRCPRDPACDN